MQNRETSLTSRSATQWWGCNRKDARYLRIRPLSNEWWRFPPSVAREALHVFKLARIVLESTPRLGVVQIIPMKAYDYCVNNFGLSPAFLVS